MRDLDERGIELARSPAPQKLERAKQISTEDRDGAGHTGAAGGAESVRVSASDQHRAGTQAERLGDVAAATDAAVEQHFGSCANSRDNFRQRAQSRRNGIELTPAVV